MNQTVQNGKSQVGESANFNNYIEHFCQYTTIPEIRRIVEEDSKLLKLWWAFVLATGLTVSVALSYKLLWEYAKYEVCRTSASEMATTIPMPTITFWQISSNTKAYKFPLVECYIVKTDKNKTRYENFISDPNLIRFYENSLVYNPGWNGNGTSIAMDEKFVCAVNIWRTSEQNILVTFTTPGPHPSERQLFVAPYIPMRTHMTTLVTARKFIRLPPPYETRCVGLDSKISREGFGYNLSMPYMYSVQKCMDSGHFYAQKINRLSEIENLDCPQPCLEYVYDIVHKMSDKREDALREYISDEFVKAACTFENASSSAICEDKISILEVVRSSIEMQVTTEEPKVTVQTLLASIGGNLGLWISVSILSVIEVMILIWQLLFENFKSTRPK